MKTVKLGLLFFITSSFIYSSAFASDNSCGEIIKNFPGTYILAKRTLSDGTVLTGPKVQGTLSFGQQGRSSVAISVHNPKNDSYDMVSLQTHYTISAKRFTNQLIAMALQFGTLTSPVHYVFDQPTESSPIVCQNGTLDISHPADYPLSDLKITSQGKMLAYHNDANLNGAIDEWTKIK